ncbi:hypothetical protein NHX12_011078 [Muraenolepis orangiensis]|uniref:Uncharacterized protein n=1 Tax=Muraenolepis orangiensis TaxID=630683 RepID=A0A9Q0DFN2_9TELE|nr:hypothetical protein NHX12_011078 [Muraenolepis orangiensis]
MRGVLMLCSLGEEGLSLHRYPSLLRQVRPPSDTSSHSMSFSTLEDQQFVATSLRSCSASLLENLGLTADSLLKLYSYSNIKAVQTNPFYCKPPLVPTSPPSNSRAASAAPPPPRRLRRAASAAPPPPRRLRRAASAAPPPPRRLRRAASAAPPPPRRLRRAASVPPLRPRRATAEQDRSPAAGGLAQMVERSLSMRGPDAQRCNRETANRRSLCF